MKLIIFLITMILSVSDCLAHEVEKITTTLTQKQEAIQFFDNYMQHYNDYLSDTNNTSALKTMADGFHLPTFQVIPGVPLRVLNSAESLSKGSQGFLNRLMAQGVAYIKWEKVHIEMLTDKTAYASNVGVRYKKNGEIFNRAAADYIILKTEGSWKIVALVLHSPQPFKNPQLEQEVSDFFAIYLKNYNDTLAYDDDNISGNIPPLVATGEDLNIPAINVSQLGDFLLFESKQQIVADTKAFIFTLKSQGAARINYDKVQIKLLTESTAIVSNIASINSKDSTAMFKIGATYIVNKTPEGWKIILRTIHAPETILNINQEKKS